MSLHQDIMAAPSHLASSSSGSMSSLAGCAFGGGAGFAFRGGTGLWLRLPVSSVQFRPAFCLFWRKVWFEKIVSFDFHSWFVCQKCGHMIGSNRAGLPSRYFGEEALSLFTLLCLHLSC